MVSIEGDTVGTPAYLAHLRDGLIPFTADRSLPVHPVQVYEAMAMGVVFLVLLHLWQRERLTGRLAPAFVLSYCLTRFGLEFIRVQEPVLWGLTLAQILSVGIGAGAAAWLVLGRKASTMHGRGLKDEPAGQAT